MQLRHRKIAALIILATAFPVLASDVVATVASGHEVLLSPKNPSGTGAVEVHLQRVFVGGAEEKNSCRMMITVENATLARIGFFGQFNTYDRQQASSDVWFVAAAGMAPGGRAKRVFSCGALAEAVALFDRSPDGWPSRCEVDGTLNRPCRVPVRVFSNLKVLAAPPADPTPPAEAKK